MIARLRRSQEEDKGFTLVELLVVIIIIGILSAVAVPVYLNQQKKAKDTAANSDVSTIGKEIQAALVDTTADKISIQQTGTGTSARYTLTVEGSTPVDLGRASADVKLVSAAGVEATDVDLTKVEGTEASEKLDSTNWCIAVTTASGSNKTYRYSAKSGIESGKSCDGTEAS
jgi:type IV pilus assembly protein PilA